jgi:hypothetical protein
MQEKTGWEDLKRQMKELFFLMRSAISLATTGKADSNATIINEAAAKAARLGMTVLEKKFVHMISRISFGTQTHPS